MSSRRWTCRCGATVLLANRENHLMRVDGGPHGEPITGLDEARRIIEDKLRHERALPSLMTSVGFQSGLEFALRALTEGSDRT